MLDPRSLNPSSSSWRNATRPSDLHVPLAVKFRPATPHCPGSARESKDSNWRALLDSRKQPSNPTLLQHTPEPWVSPERQQNKQAWEKNVPSGPGKTPCKSFTALLDLCVSNLLRIELQRMAPEESLQTPPRYKINVRSQRHSEASKLLSLGTLAVLSRRRPSLQMLQTLLD